MGCNGNLAEYSIASGMQLLTVSHVGKFEIDESEVTYQCLAYVYLHNLTMYCQLAINYIAWRVDSSITVIYWTRREVHAKYTLAHYSITVISNRKQLVVIATVYVIATFYMWCCIISIYGIDADWLQPHYWLVAVWVWTTSLYGCKLHHYIGVNYSTI